MEVMDHHMREPRRRIFNVGSDDVRFKTVAEPCDFPAVARAVANAGPAQPTGFQVVRDGGERLAVGPMPLLDWPLVPLLRRPVFLIAARVVVLVEDVE